MKFCANMYRKNPIEFESQRSKSHDQIFGYFAIVRYNHAAARQARLDW